MIPKQVTEEFYLPYPGMKIVVGTTDTFDKATV
jgi:hypothetical protein